MEKIRKGDDVIVTTGKDKGKARDGAAPRGCKAPRREGVNRSQEASAPQPIKGLTGGIVDKDMPIDISNVALFNPHRPKEADRIGFKLMEDGRKVPWFSHGEMVDA